ncbi:HofP DNA utilization family protein [Brenneria roseae]|uniref:HofP DNA utilization family protein n=1 Tax=Brenneria roseae TaxID=1509241 RepID=UPI001FF88CE1|nr:HofP DNA utilization family protein [Brenneria roseae]
MNKANGSIRMALLPIALCTLAPAPGNALEIRRDPFHPLPIAACSQINAAQQWQMKGVIGTGEHWVGWLAQSDDQWIKLKRGEVIPPGSWQVSQLDKSGMQLTPVARTGSCDGLPAMVSLASPFINKLVAH